MSEHSYFMRRAIELAKNGYGFVNPNPLVGAVIVKDGKIIGEGWHEACGLLHAERHALKNCTENPKGAAIYVTLEPCCHHGKQPPCVEALIESGIQTVYIGSRDPNPLVAGKGAAILRQAGITVVEDVLREECDLLNSIFFHYITKKYPYVICKYAMTADGKIACSTGASRWVTGEAARANVQQTRKGAAAILVGIGTVLADDPSLACHAENPSHPTRIVCDSMLRIPLDCQLVRTAREIPVIVMTTEQADAEKIAALTASGVQVITVPADEQGHTDLSAVFRKIGELGLDSVLVEGGGQIHAAALQTGMVSLLQVYVAPKLFGGDGYSPVAAMNIREPSDAVRCNKPTVQVFGEDLLLSYPLEVKV